MCRQSPWAYLSPLELASEDMVAQVTDAAALLDSQCHCLNLALHLRHSHVVVTHHTPDGCKELIPVQRQW